MERNVVMRGKFPKNIICLILGHTKCNCDKFCIKFPDLMICSRCDGDYGNNK